MNVVRVQMKERPERSRFERLLLVAPDAVRSLAGPVFGLPPGSRLRTAALRMVADRAYSALNREDLELVERLFYRRDVVLNFAGDIGPDYASRYEGRDECFRIYRQWLKEWGTVRRRPFGFVDRGNVVVFLGYETIRGESSGLEIERELGQVFRLRGAGVAEQTEFRSWDEALAA